MKKLLALLLVILLFTGCTNSPENLTAKFTPVPTPIEPTSTDAFEITQMRFAFDMLKGGVQTDKNENVLISPLSIKLALAMLYNGADGKTKEQMQSVIELTPEILNKELNYYYKNLPGSEKAKLHIANSLWLKDDPLLTVQDSFLQTNVNYYNAEVYKAPFDTFTKKQINNWVSKNTDNMIKEIVNEINPNTVMFLINALCFDAQWQDIYKKDSVSKKTFYSIDGKKQNVDFMYSSEYSYICDANSTGFIKKYDGGKYAFGAILPNENVDIYDYINKVDPYSFLHMLKNPSNETVKTYMPKFEFDYSIELNTILKNLGMVNAFDGSADFSKIGTYGSNNLFVSRILHKTHITVDEKGTKAGAVTSIAMAGSAMNPVKPKEVILDRPFIFAIFDTETCLPTFIGIVTKI